MTRWLKAAAAALAVSLIAGCGGGGGDSNNNNNQASSPSSPPPAGSNQVAAVINKAVSNTPNIPTVTVTVCAPGSASQCQTIDNVLLDSKSFGLRILNSSLSSIAGSLPNVQSNTT